MFLKTNPHVFTTFYGQITRAFFFSIKSAYVRPQIAYAQKLRFGDWPVEGTCHQNLVSDIIDSINMQEYTCCAFHDLSNALVTLKHSTFLSGPRKFFFCEVCFPLYYWFFFRFLILRYTLYADNTMEFNLLLLESERSTSYCEYGATRVVITVQTESSLVE